MKSSTKIPKHAAHESSALDPATIDFMKPGPEHALLTKLVGTWEVVYDQWLKEGDEPIHATGKAVFTLEFAGRFVVEKFTGEFQGQPFIGIGTMGFNRLEKRFVNTWYDNTRTGINYTTGTSSHDGKEITFQGTLMCPIKLIPLRIRHVYARESDDRFTMTMFVEDNGKERKSMVIVYTRQR